MANPESLGIPKRGVEDWGSWKEGLSGCGQSSVRKLHDLFLEFNDR